MSSSALRESREGAEGARSTARAIRLRRNPDLVKSRFPATTHPLLLEAVKNHPKDQKTRPQVRSRAGVGTASVGPRAERDASQVRTQVQSVSIRCATT